MKKLSQETKDVVTIFGLVLIGICFTFVFGIIVLHYNINNNDDVYNWATLAIEIGIGIGITLTVWKFSKRDQSRIRELIDDVKKIETKQQEMIEEQHTVLKDEQKRIERWKNDYGILILENLESILSMYEILESWLIEFKQNPSPQQKSNIINAAKTNGHIIEFHVQNLKKYLPKIENYFNDPKLSTQIVGFCEQLSALFPSLHMDYHWESNLEGTFHMIGERKKILEEHIERMKQEIPSHNKP